MSRFDACLAITLPWEGGWSNHPADPGGATMRGITLATYRRYRPGATADQLRRISDPEVRSIYRQGYWSLIKGGSLTAGIDAVTFDAGVNSGPAQGAKWTQRALGVTADGKVGPQTLRAARTAEPIAVIRKASANRLGMLRGLRTWGAFGRGWSNRVADVEAKAIAMAAAATGAARPVLIEEKGAAQFNARRDEAGAVGVGGGGGGGVTLADLPSWGVVALAVVAAVAVVMLLGARRHQLARADALQRAAEEAKR